MDVSQHVVDISEQRFGRAPDQAIMTKPVGARTFVTVTIESRRYLFVFCTKEQCETDIFFMETMKKQGIVSPDIIHSGLLLDAGWYIIPDIPVLSLTERESRREEMTQLLKKLYTIPLKGAGFIHGTHEFYTVSHDSVAAFLRDFSFQLSKESLWTQKLEETAKRLMPVLVHGNLGADVWHIYRDKVCLLYPGSVVALCPEFDYAAYLSVHNDTKDLFSSIPMNEEVVSFFREMGV
ncbi:MAG: hypothetical protein QY314_03400 [Candidatus Dojkabacteria bacterium]|nr:MAG: hypothetical protein QY314_03400 [Candidatus Dojkabacteria bacterium]